MNHPLERRGCDDVTSGSRTTRGYGWTPTQEGEEATNVDSLNDGHLQIEAREVGLGQYTWP